MKTNVNKERSITKHWLTMRTVFGILLIILSLGHAQMRANIVGSDGVSVCIIDETTWSEVSSAPLTMTGYSGVTLRSISRNPFNNLYYAIVGVSGDLNAYLARVEVEGQNAGTCHYIGILGERFQSLTFNTKTGALYGTLYAIQGAEQTPHSMGKMFEVNTTTAALTFRKYFGSEKILNYTLAFNNDDDRIYLWYGWGDGEDFPGLTKFDPVGFSETVVFQSGDPIKYFIGALYAGNGEFLASGVKYPSGTAGYKITASGVITFSANTSNYIFGLADIPPNNNQSGQVVPFYGSSLNEGNGLTTAGIGDFNGDGFDDFLITSVNGGGTNIGTAKIYFGQSNYPVNAPNPDIVITGEAGEGFGNSAAGNFDLNDDGFKDIIIGASQYGGNAGRVYIFYGRCNFPSARQAVNADLIYQGGAPGDRLGFCVSKAGDLNGDCLDDVMMSAPYSINWSGSVYILFGGNLNPPPAISQLVRLSNNSPIASGLFGYSTSSVGDINNDGVDDIIIGEPVNLLPGGMAHIILGNCNLTFIGIVLFGENTNGNDFGISVGGLGDINGNGYRDFIVGDWQYPSYTEGKAYVYDGIQLSPAPSGYITPLIYEINEQNTSAPYAYFSSTVAGIGDYTGDGLNDFLIGGRGYDDILQNVGREYRFPGVTTPNNIVNLPSGYDIMTGPTAGAQVGYSNSWAGDINGDGRNDALWSAPGAEDLSGNVTGAVYLDLSKSVPTSYTTLNLTAFVQGRTGVTEANVCLYDEDCNFVDEKNVFLQPNGIAYDADGTPGIKFNNLPPNTSAYSNKRYYVVVKAMCNGIVETWSKLPMNMVKGGSYSYDFSTSANQAYMDNQVLENGHYAIYNGDVNGNGFVNLNDMVEIYNNPWKRGCCLREDLNANGFVDLPDLILAYNNGTIFVQCFKPCTCPCP